MCVCVRTRTYVRVYLYTYVCVCVCVCVCIYMVTRIEILGKNLHIDGNSLFPTLVLLLENYGKTFTNILSLSRSLSHVHMHTRTNPTNCTTAYSIYFLSNFILISSAYGNSIEQVVVQLLGYVCNVLKLNKCFCNKK